MEVLQCYAWCHSIDVTKTVLGEKKHRNWFVVYFIK